MSSAEKPTPFYRLARAFWPELDNSSAIGRLSGTASVLSVVYSLPFALLGLVWLVLESDFSLVSKHWPIILCLVTLVVIADRLSFYVIVDTGDGHYANSESSLDTLVLMSGILIIGPTAAWIGILRSSLLMVVSWVRSPAKADRWNALRVFSLTVVVYSLMMLLSLWAYEALGGAYPLPGLETRSTLAALAAMGIFLAGSLLVWSGYILFIMRQSRSVHQSPSTRPFLHLTLMGIVFPGLANPFAIIAAGLFVQNGLIYYLFYMVGVILSAWLARLLSHAAEVNRQRFRQLEMLEKLGEALINAPPDASTLPQILAQYVPPMFPGRTAIWVFEDHLLLKSPDEWEFDPQPVWLWLQGEEHPLAVEHNKPIPWKSDANSHRSIVAAPIYDTEHAENIGGIYVDLHSLIQPWDRKSLEALFPGILSLASQIASALRRAELYDQTLEYQKINQELALAGRIQASFLPNRMPDLPGWQLAVTLLPARATSGDFFDFIALPGGKLGIVIADVADKGIGPALYMALSRTLIRTYATQFDDQPALIIRETNKRLLSDARANLFVTVFYGVLDPTSGTFTYANAGHNPPYLLSQISNSAFEALIKTGIPIGIDEDATWEQNQVSILPGDLLILYTDGVTEAQNTGGEFFNEDLLLEAAESRLGMSAHEVQVGILEAVQYFVGDNPQSDDITLMILARNLNNE